MCQRLAAAAAHQLLSDAWKSSAALKTTTTRVSTTHGRDVICSDVLVSSLMALMPHSSSTARPVQGKRLCGARTCHRHALQRCPPRLSSRLQASQGLGTHNSSQQTSLWLFCSSPRVSKTGSCTLACWLFRGYCNGLNNSSSFQSVVSERRASRGTDSRFTLGKPCSFSCWALTSAGQHGGADVEVYAHVLSPICVHHHLLQPAQCSHVVKCIYLVDGSCRLLPG